MTPVRDFHVAVGQAAPDFPPMRPDANLVRLRMRLLREEYEEVFEELTRLLYNSNDPNDVVNTFRRLLKELADLRYVLEGCAVSFGLPIDAAYAEVHRSNMSKLVDGKALKDAGGKVLKGPNYAPPDMTQFVPDIIDI